MHPDNKTSTLSNKRFFVPKENIETTNTEQSISFKERKSIYKRIDEENFVNHLKHHWETRHNKLLNVVTGEETEELYDTDVSELNKKRSLDIDAEINEDGITIHFNKK